MRGPAQGHLIGTRRPRLVARGARPGAWRPGTAPAPVGEDQQDTTPGLGEPVREGKFEFTVKKIEPGGNHLGGEFGTDAQGRYLLAHMTVKNIGDRAQYFNGSDQKTIDSKSNEHSADTGAAIFLEDSRSFLNQINPGNTVEGIVVFDIPTNSRPVQMELHDSFLSSGATVRLAPR
ncbi:DUF4352 domain-containing protein [Streptomyces sp. NPDC051561]|uniref:DUF4352 domain-containing protein n=1 Tax=Streptomyces sp. NPDC051561 TaxID=3365658 RepID=UPI0037BCB5C6